MPYRYILTLLFLLVFRVANGQLVLTQKWRYADESCSLDTLVRVSEDSVYIPLANRYFGKAEIIKFCEAKCVFDSLLVKARTSPKLYDSLPKYNEYPLSQYKQLNMYYVSKYTVKRMGRLHYMWALTIGQGETEFSSHSPRYEIYLLQDIGCVAVLANEFVEGKQLRSCRLQSSKSNISHYKASPGLIKRSWKEIKRINKYVYE